MLKKRNQFTMPPKFREDTISTARLTSFSDGVFAIAVTLLVFNLKVPEIAKADVHSLLPGLIKAMLPHFITYILTFWLIAAYWIFHHRMLNLVIRVDSTFLWINISYLLMISFMPFPTALFASYPRETFSFVFYVCSMIVVGILSLVMSGYASYNHRLINKDMPIATIKFFFFRQLTQIGVFILSLPLAFFELRWAEYYLFIVFPINRVARGYFRGREEKRKSL
jgi:uncharacterized membrane protein